MNPTMQLVVDYLQTHEINCDSEDNRVAFGLAGQNGSWCAVIVPDDEESEIILALLLPVRVPLERRKAFAVFLARLNFTLRRMGHFHLDLDDGAILYRVSTLAAGFAENRDVVMHLLLAAALGTVDEMFPRICVEAFGHVGDAKQQHQSTGLPQDDRRWTLN